MYDRYKDFYRGRIPYLKLEKRFFDEYCAERIIIKNVNESSYYEGYSEVLKPAVERFRKMGSGHYMDNDVANMRIILVSDDLNRIRKSASILAAMCDDRSYDDDDDVSMTDEFYEDMDSFEDIFEIELGKDMADERVAGNPYIIKTQKISHGSKSYQHGGLLFRGLSTGNLDDQCAAICGVQAENIFVGITENMVKLPEIQRLIFERGFDLVRLPDVDARYYRHIADEMIEFGGVAFESDELKETVISALIRKCGTHISEEVISRALTTGLLRMKESEVEFTGKHFSEILSVESENAYEKLQKMTGLVNLKASAGEYIAVRNEMKRNPKSFLECRHLLFEGNPGGGKTMGAGILSEILASEGITNGTFVIASRKDIIGEYVGQTAPKVAKLFKEAAGGVLFVDEAGFFLNGESGGYLEEALKEFIRYMETCRDVTVIFAMYPGEADRFLDLDAGMQSRISAVVKFEDYTEKELAEIFTYMLESKGYKVSGKIAERAGDHLMNLKDRFGERFGNAREARRLADSVIKAVAIRHDAELKTKGIQPDNRITMADLTEAVSKKDSGRSSNTMRQIGFDAGNSGVRRTPGVRRALA